MTASLLLFPQAQPMYDYPGIKSLATLEKNIIEIQKHDDNQLNVWRHFQALLIEEFATINYEEVSEEEMAVLFDKIKNLAMPILKSVMKQGAKNLKSLSSYELYLLSSMVESSLKVVKKGSIAYRFMNHMNKKLQGYEKTPFEYQVGLAAEKKLDSSVSIFNWNTCLLPGKLSKIFSGLEPWQDRIEPMIAKIKQQNADVLCLQEVHSEPAAFCLYEALKNDYAHFYMNMGPKIMASQLTDVGLNSGLFVASKYPLEDIHFEVFDEESSQQMINKGFFWAKIKSSDLGFLTAHLEPLDNEASKQKRLEELKYLTGFLAVKNTTIKILSGDLNVPWGSQEKAELWMKAYFFDPYNKGRQLVTHHSRTFSDVFMTQKGQGSCDILDYFLIYQTPGFERYAFITERVEGFDEMKFESHSSDHHGLLSHIVFPKDQK